MSVGEGEVWLCVGEDEDISCCCCRSFCAVSVNALCGGTLLKLNCGGGALNKNRRVVYIKICVRLIFLSVHHRKDGFTYLVISSSSDICCSCCGTTPPPFSSFLSSSVVEFIKCVLMRSFSFFSSAETQYLFLLGIY